MNLRIRFRRRPLPLGALLGVLGLAGASAFAPLAASAQERDGSYSYIRTLDGSASLIPVGSQIREPAEINQPILEGDRLRVDRGSRVELILADRTRVHIDGQSEVAFDALALSPDSEARASRLNLFDGEIRIATDDFPSAARGGAEPPEVETGNATIYLSEHGSFRLTVDGDDWSEVTVREGSAEVETERGSQLVRERERAEIEGPTRARVAIGPAEGADALERWAEALFDRSDSYSGYVDDDLGYASESLSRYGSWSVVSGQRVWRPRVSSTWRPYALGRWRNSPSGAIWVSSEPWGWVPYHYGTWDYFPSFGWAWVPGRVFAPSWTYWYWGPDYVGWCPTGYYTRYYGGSGFRDGTYGWAHGSGSFFAEWNFVPFNNFGDRSLGNQIRRGRDLPITLGRGIVTTDTRPLGRERWNDPTRAIDLLRRGRPNLPDVSDFVARKRDLPPSVRQEIVIDRDRPSDALVGTPLRPGTLGRGADDRAPGAPAGGPAKAPRGRTDWNPNDGGRVGQPAVDTSRPGTPRTGVDRGEDRGNSGDSGRSTGGRSGLDTPATTERDRGGRSGLDTPAPPATTERETGRGAAEQDRGGRSGLDTPVTIDRETGRDRSPRDGGSVSNDRTGGDTRDDGARVERQRPAGRDPAPSTDRPEVEERRPPTYDRPSSGDSSRDSARESRPEPTPAREAPVVRERPAPPADPPPTAARRRDEPSAPPQEEAKPREREAPSNDTGRTAAPSDRGNSERRRPRDNNNDGSPPPP